MSKREKIILVIMAVVVVFGIYNFLFSSSGGKKPVNPATAVADANKFIADVANSLKDDSTETNMYIIRKARGEWAKDPFWIAERKPETKTEAVAESRNETRAQESRVYTGYLEMGEQRLAIINGAEYQPGDELGRGGPVVKSIDPKQVIIALPGTTDEMILPLREPR